MKKTKGAETSPRPVAINNKRCPELIKGVRIQYINRDSATRSEVIHSRDKNTIVVKDALGKKRNITIDRVIGYWPERVAPISRNLIRLKDIKELVQQQLPIMDLTEIKPEDLGVS